MEQETQRKLRKRVLRFIKFDMQFSGYKIILDSSMVEHPAVNRRVVGSSPTRGVAGDDALKGNTRSHFEHDG